MKPIALTDAAEAAYQKFREQQDAAAQAEAGRRRKALRHNAAKLAGDLFDLDVDDDAWILDDLGAILEIPGDYVHLAYLPSTGADGERFVPVLPCPAGCGRYVPPAANGAVGRGHGNPLAKLGTLIRRLDERVAVCLCRYNEDHTRIVRDEQGDPIPSSQAPSSAEVLEDNGRAVLEAAAKADPVATVLLELVDRLDAYAARALGEA